MFCFILTACGSETNQVSDKNTSDDKSVKEILLENNYKEIATNQYQKVQDDGSYILISMDDKKIILNDAQEDSQIEYNVNDNTAWEYGCRYHYDNGTTSNDGEGYGECDNSTIQQLITGKQKIDDELNSLNLNLDDLK